MTRSREQRRHDYLKRCYVAQASLCGICGKVMPAPRRWANLPLTAKPNLEHVVPLSRGGTDTMWNSVASHSDCNVGKGNRLPHPCELIFLAAVRLRLSPERPQASALEAARKRAGA